MRAISAALVMLSGSIMMASALDSATAAGPNGGATAVGLVGVGVSAIGIIAWFVMLFIGDKTHG